MKESASTIGEGDALSRLRGLFPSLSPAEKRVGEFILENPENVIRMTLAEIASQTGVSDATAVRFCRSIGYEGWLEFKIALTQALPKSPRLIHADISAEDNPGLIARKVLQGSKQALDDTLAMLDEKTFEHVLDLLVNAENILIAGVGTSSPMAHEMFNRLFRLGLKCQVQTDSYLQVMQVALMTEKDLLLVISQSGDSIDPRRTAAEARHRNIPVVCITGNILSPLAEYADAVLLSVSQEIAPETISSRVAQYALIHAVYVGLAMRSLDHTIENERLIWNTLMHHNPFQSGNG
jgi:RpiR family transcriptional regulator, carbohydrate utilization regulator